MTKQRINTNALDGYRCPVCGSPGPLHMTTTCIMPWDDEGTDFAASPEIEPSGFTTCGECGHNAETAEFDMERRYVNRGGIECPYCSSEHIEGNSVEIDAHSAWQEMSCNDCCAGWQDVYKLIGINNFPDDDFVQQHNEETEDNDDM